ncbi:MAG: hypothetical protein H6Q10_2951 [Acidobacteria bacterium]|nr:hypothetical protein [Acidobacteriota bacterium]
MAGSGGDPNLAGLSELDRLVHEPGRLIVLACLLPVERADYLYVLRQSGLTQGNLSSHLAKLEAGGYVKVEKTFAGKTPRTLLSLTPVGRAAFKKYREQITAVLARL